MRIGKLVFGGLLVLIALPGCGGSDDPDPKQKCDDLVTRFCTSAINCQVSGGFIEASDKATGIASCKSAVIPDVVDCPKAKGISSTYNACMTKLSNPPCDEVNQAIADDSLGVPDECNGTILFSE